MTALAVAVTLACSGLALAYDRDNDNDDYYGRNNTQAHKHRRDGDRDDRDGWRNRDNDRNRGWRRGDGDGDRDDRGSGNWRNNGRYGRRNGVYSGGRVYSRGNYPTDQTGYPQGAFGGNPGFRYGYSDGAKMANADMSQRKPFNPEPRGKYDDRDGGYQRVDGDKNAYKVQYSNGYRAGYEATFGRYWDWRHN
ncbi:MAG: hypothetical protein AUI17_02180 [Acidobacteriales bacterium 13_2_20CM_2_55_5]|nr:MAG: hypothetical protein AUI17_02180 [Acidobacteriales bacterium 13_2_20CM_2_55_5]